MPTINPPWRGERLIVTPRRGATPQAGLLAGAGLHAIRYHRERLVDDHAAAAALAEGKASQKRRPLAIVARARRGRRATRR